MKHLFLTALAALTIGFAGKAQNFVGTVTYAMKLKNPPAGVSEAMLAQYVPSKMVMYVGKTQMATTLNAGAFSKIIMPLDGDTAYMVSEMMKKIFTMTSKEADSAGKKAGVNKPTIKKTAATATVAGYPCTMYEVTMDVQGQSVKQMVWATDKVTMPKPRVNGQSMYNSEVPGMMLKSTVKVGGMDLEMEATEVSTVAPSPEAFQLPALPHTLFSAENLQKSAGGK